MWCMSLYWTIYTLLALSLPSIELSVAGGSSIRSWRPCSWLTPSDDSCSTINTPVLGLVFIHMRKAGGTRVLDSVKRWMKSRGCINDKCSLEMYSDTGKHTIFQNNHLEYPCPSFDIVHNEYQYVNSEAIAVLTNSSLIDNKSPHLSFLTVLRHPIDRIGSQAFFQTGVNHHTVFEKVVADVVSARCAGSVLTAHACSSRSTSYSKHSIECECVHRATEEGLRTLRNNESLWFKWMEDTTFNDGYMPNYYLRRLVGALHTEEGHRWASHSDLQRCFRDREECRNSSRYTDSYHMLVDLSTVQHRENPAHVSLDISQALSSAKEFLQRSVHILISEYLDDPSSGSVFRAAVMDFSYNYYDTTHSNSGAFSGNITTSLPREPLLSPDRVGYTYYNKFPPTVLNRLLEENKEDIELYLFAKRLYWKRLGRRNV